MLHGSHAVLGLWLLLSTGQNTLFPVLSCNKQAAGCFSGCTAGGCVEVSAKEAAFGLLPL